MQPTLVITAPIPGMVFINGRFLGECSPDAPLYAPTAPFGALYLEYHPLESGWSNVARKLVMSGGRPLTDHLPNDLYLILWPDSITEIEISPSFLSERAMESIMLGPFSCKYFPGKQPVLEIGTCLCPLPENASKPEFRSCDACTLLTGQTDSDRYLLTFTADASKQTGLLRADRFEWESSDVIRMITYEHDALDHALAQRWQLTSDGPQLLSEERICANGSPRQPATPEETALVCTEALLRKDFSEAERFLAPSLRSQLPLLSESDSACLPLKYALPSEQSCIGLLSMINEQCAVVHPLRYHADRQNGQWLLTELQTT